MRVSTPAAIVVALVLLLAGSALAQEPAHAPRATVHGVVVDSLGSAPLAGAIVELAPVEDGESPLRSVRSDGLGRFEFPDVSPGRYTLGFHHPLLESLGLAPIHRTVAVQTQSRLQADLAIPGPRRLQSILCGASADSPDEGFLVGSVRHGANGVPVQGATVVAEWTNLTFDGRNLADHRDGRLTDTRANGWFVLCDLPAGGTVVLTAVLDDDNTDPVETPIPATGFVRRDLFIGAVGGARPVASGGAGSDAPRTGSARLAGVVVQEEGGGPVAGARIRIATGDITHSNDRGSWTLSGVPYGTRVVEVRADGFEPVRLNVDVTGDALAVRVALHPRVIPLAPVHVVATRMTGLAWSGFEARRRSFGGRFITGADIERRRFFNVSDALETIPGLRRERTVEGRQLLMRGLFTGECAPTVFLNGSMMHNLTADDLDGMVQPRDVAGVEIYSPPHIPSEFVASLSGCGSIVIWTR